MSDVFADTFYFLALYNPADAAHQKAVTISSSLPRRIITTAFVVIELGDALSSPGQRPEFARLLDIMEQDPGTTIIEATQELLDKGIALFKKRPDKEWSLTDCTSYVVMQERGITEALTGDHHFEQPGFHILLK